MKKELACVNYAARNKNPGASYLMMEKHLSDIHWTGIDGRIGKFVQEESQQTLEAYRSQPNLITEQANQEQDTARGGYSHRQIVELVQNGADQLSQLKRGGRMEIRLTPDHLYCADAGEPISEDGAKALLFSHLSPKRGTLEIGRFGVGFKSILGVATGADFFSHSGSLRFDREWAAERIRAVAPYAERFPVLRIAEPVDPYEAAKTDPLLRNIMEWATNIVRLPLKPNAYDALTKQMQDFRPEFLLFATHVRQLELSSNNGEVIRTLQLKIDDERFELLDGEHISQWRVFRRVHKLSDEAKEDARTLDDPEEVELKWAVPLRSEPDIQHFWAFFPTMTSSLLTGILNAPWKTNEDRQNLLPGPYNNELIETAAKLAAKHLHCLSSLSDPAKHLDVLPKRMDTGDNEHASQLRARIYTLLNCHEVVPDQDGNLRRQNQIQYPPPEFISTRKMVVGDALAIWAGYKHRPSDWLHHDAVTVDRLGVVDRIFTRGERYGHQGAPRASIAEWLEALVEAGRENDDAVNSSRVAIAAAAALPEELHRRHPLGEIVLMASGGRAEPKAESVFLGNGMGGEPSTTVHPDLEADPDTLKALKTLGVRPLSAENLLRNLANTLSQVVGDAAREDSRWERFWLESRSVEQETLNEIIAAHFSREPVRVRTVGQTWEPANEVLLPGPLVPGDSSRDEFVAVDVAFHEPDMTRLRMLGIADQPYDEYKPSENCLHPYLSECQRVFQFNSRKVIGRTPQWDRLVFDNSTTTGPFQVLEYLSDEGASKFTAALLNIHGSFRPWVMRHATQPQYGEMKFPSPAIQALRLHGQVSVGGRFLPLAGGLGEKPEHPEVQRWLLTHQNTRLIRREFSDLVFDFSDDAEPVGDEQVVPLMDVWPGLADEIADGENLLLVRCRRIVDRQGRRIPSDCVRKDNLLYLVRQDDERRELEVIVRELHLDLDGDAFERILQRETRKDVQRERERVRRHATDAERLLAAVGEERLRLRLPSTLIDILDSGTEPFVDVRVAEAAIATFHTGALKEYRHDIQHLGPPYQWAGGAVALAFVKALGFGPEWAGHQGSKREAFLDVSGPRSLPDLHAYQRNVVDKVKTMLSGASDENRGLVSLPTGSGKTRVAVQAVIESMRDQGLSGTVLWVADRDELCEQAVEAWRQAWASIGTEAEPLRVSRWWGGQPQPETIDGRQVVVATIQTLRSRIKRDGAMAALADVREALNKSRPVSSWRGRCR
ncbi:MAG: DEAD/DEAH box helicase, partial [Gammaproteobacteria bacterium]|nr:DEAD/DEAH box helicase [Gammaproteobacteria bacterium]